MPKRRNKKIEFGAWSHSRGHSIVHKLRSPIWVFEDTLEKCYHQRACAKCLKFAEHNTPDPCIGWLPDVRYACCGHGIKGHDYVLMNDGERLSLDEYCERTGFKKPTELI